MAEPSKPAPWPVAHVKFKESVPFSTTGDRGTQLTEGRTADQSLRIEFNPEQRMVVLYARRPAKDGKGYMDNPDRPPVLVPIENVVFMR